MGLTLITPASSLPVTAAQVKLLTRIDDTAFDDLLGLLLPAAHRAIGELAGASLGEQAWQLTLDAFSDAIELQRGPVTAVSAVGYTDPDGAAQVVDPAIYTIDLASTPQWLVRNADSAWPTPLDRINAVTVDFTAGWTDATLPDDLRLAVAGLVQHWFESGPAAPIPAGVTNLVAPWRNLWICA